MLRRSNPTSRLAADIVTAIANVYYKLVTVTAHDTPLAVTVGWAPPGEHRASFISANRSETFKIPKGVGLDIVATPDNLSRVSQDSPTAAPKHLDGPPVFSCPGCGHPGAMTGENNIDIHAGATYTCDECGADVIFDALTVAEYTSRYSKPDTLADRLDPMMGD